VLDMVRAARKLDSSLGKRVVIAGHSQGGQAALFAGSLAKKWAPDVTLRGTVAFAPVSHLALQGASIRDVKTAGGISGLAAMIIRGIDIANPDLKIPTLLGDRAKALYPQLDQRCLSGINKSDSFGALAPADLFKADVQLDPIVAALRKDADPDALKLPGPVLIEQGKADTTVFPFLTDQLATELKGNGVAVTYSAYDGLTHGEAVTDEAPATDATSWIKKRL
jgi:fermentation-respiration switch protein FrsA (DUF1100 family)